MCKLNLKCLAVALVSLSTALMAQENTLREEVVTEALDTGDYVYLFFEESGTWLATGPSDVVVGDRVSWTDGMEMRDFHSKALDRTFEQIFFVGKINVAQRDVEALHASAQDNADPHAQRIEVPIAATPPRADEIEPLEGGLAIVDLLGQAASLEGRSVNLRAKVIKVSEGIMGRNWITLQDGSGEVEGAKLIATSTEMPGTGEIFNVQGIVRNDVDLGSGYLYKVLLEESRFSH